MNTDSNEEQPVFAHTSFAWLGVGLVLLSYLIGSVALSVFVDIKPDDPRMAVFQGASQLLFMFVPTLLVMRLSPLGYNGLLRLRDTNIRARHWMLVVVGLILVQAFSTGWDVVQSAILPEWLSKMLSGFNESRDSMMRSILGSGDVFSIVIATIAVVIVPACSEELLFRGLMQRSLEQSLGIRAAIIHTSMFFALAHFAPLDFIPLLFISALLSFLASSSRSLLPGIVLHLANNSVALTASYVPSLRDVDTSTFVNLWQAVALVVVSMVVIGLVVRFVRRADMRSV